jgi:hypothetical protein
MSCMGLRESCNQCLRFEAIVKCRPCQRLVGRAIRCMSQDTCVGLSPTTFCGSHVHTQYSKLPRVSSRTPATHIAWVHNGWHSTICVTSDVEFAAKVLARIARRWSTLLGNDSSPLRPRGDVGAITAAKCPHKSHPCRHTHPKRRRKHCPSMQATVAND